MVISLIVIGVVLFLLIDAYVLYRVVSARRSADGYGGFPVPGETTVTLPAGGKLKLTYQESRKAPRRGDSIDLGVPSGLAVMVTSPSGEAVELNRPGFRGMGSSLSTGSGWSRALIGTVELPEPGTYAVSAQLASDGQVEPQVLLDK